MSPASPLVQLACRDLERTIKLFKAIVGSSTTTVLKKDVEWLEWLYEKAVRKIEQRHVLSQIANTHTSTFGAQDPNQNQEHLDLVGWRTRLVKLGENRTDSMSHSIRASEPGQGDFFSNKHVTSTGRNSAAGNTSSSRSGRQPPVDLGVERSVLDESPSTIVRKLLHVMNSLLRYMSR